MKSRADTLLQTDHPAATCHWTFQQRERSHPPFVAVDGFAGTRRRAIGLLFAGREDLEELLLEGLASGASALMTAARKKRIYRKRWRRRERLSTNPEQMKIWLRAHAGFVRTIHRPPAVFWMCF